MRAFCNTHSDLHLEETDTREWYKWDKGKLCLNIMRMLKETIIIDYHNTSGLDLLDLSYYYISMAIRNLSFLRKQDVVLF